MGGTGNVNSSPGSLRTQGRGMFGGGFRFKGGDCREATKRHTGKRYAQRLWVMEMGRTRYRLGDCVVCRLATSVCQAET